MKIEFLDDGVINRYILNYEEQLILKNNEILNNINSLEIDLGMNKNTLELYIHTEKKQNEATSLTDSLELLNTAFEKIHYELNSDGTVKSVNNYLEILDKYSALYEMIKNSTVRESLFSLSGIVNNSNKCNELLKRFSIIPYLCIGYCNQELKERIPLIKEGILYNIYGNEDIEVRYEIYDASSKEDEKMVLVKGKESPNFDRKKFISEIHNLFSDIPLYQIGIFDFTCNGKYIYSIENILKHMEFSVKILLKGIFEYNVIFKLVMKEEENGI